MPYTIRKVRNKPCYHVYRDKSRKILSKCATLKNAKKQIALLGAIEHTPGFVPNNNKKRRITRKKRY